MNGFLNGAPRMPLETVMQLPHLRANSASPSWAPGSGGMEAAFKPPPSVPAGFSPEEFARFSTSRVQGPGAVAATSVTHANTMMGPSPSLGLGMVGMPMGGNYMMGQPGYTHMPMYGMMGPETRTQQQHHQPLNDSSRVVELDDEKWQEHFDKIDLMDKEQKDQEKGKGKATETSEWTDLGEQNHGDFESIWRALKDEQDTAGRLRSELGESEDVVDDWQNFDQSWLGNSGWESDLIHLEQYTFEVENVYDKHPNPFEEGMRIMREGGNLSLAALAFEAAVQNEPDHIEAWVQLGSAQAQNEKESAAIRALKKAVSLAPTNLPALMGLAVSYTNEGYESHALMTLERWLNSKYPTVLPDAELTPSGGEFMKRGDRDASYERITNYFIRAAQMSPDGEHMDPDVQVGLGVLFYSQEQYDKAVDCFQAALDSSVLGTSTQREQVHLLWNRLGATLANSGKPEAAIGAYQQALRLRPHFVRARYNLGVSCIAMRLLDQAAIHLLAGLALHREIEKSARDKVAELVGGDASSAHVEEQLARMDMNRSDTLVDTLRRVFLQMGRKDLAEKCEINVDPEIFRPQFQF